MDTSKKIASVQIWQAVQNREDAARYIYQKEQELIMASIFKKSVVMENVENLQIDNLVAKAAVVQSWYDPYKSGLLQTK